MFGTFEIRAGVKGSTIPFTNFAKGRLGLNPIAVTGVFGLCASAAAPKGTRCVHEQIMKCECESDLLCVRSHVFLL